MKLGLSLGGWYTTSQRMASVAKFAEDAGFEYLYTADTTMICRDAFITLALCAERTKKIKLGPAVTPVSNREPAIIANLASTLDEVSGGRGILGLGTGDSGVRRIGKRPATLDELRKITDLIRRLMEGKKVDFGGSSFSMRWAKSKIPVYFAATGPKMLQLSGEIADGVMFMAGVSPELVKYAVDNVRKGAESAGRDPKEIDIACFAYSYLDEDRIKAQEMARAAALWYFRNAPHLVKLAGGEAPDLKSMDYEKHDYVHDDKYDEKIQVPKFVTRELAAKFLLAGNPEDYLKRIKDMERLGVTQLIVRHTALENKWENFLHNFVQWVIPKLM